MEKISFFKMTGAGNDFIIIETCNNPDIVISERLIVELCDRYFGIGADGLITISDSEVSDFEMTYYNSDGSTGTLCGNGSRCAVWFAKYKGYFVSEKCTFATDKHKYFAEVLDDEVIKFYLDEPKDILLNQEVEIDCGKIRYHFIDTGSPHAVVILEENKYLKDLIHLDVYNLGRELRAKINKPDGCNINFIDVKDKQINIRTYERGVENETLACGTGSVASAVACRLKKYVQLPAKINTIKNIELIVDAVAINDDIINVSLTGPAKIVFSGTYDIEKF